MKNLQDWFSEYGESHQNATNKAIHWICVPAIFFSIIGLLWCIPVDFISSKFPYPLSVFINPASLISFFVLLFYLRLSFKIFLGILFIVIIGLTACFYIQRFSSIPLWAISLTVFVIAWIGQFYGHKIEGKKPSFLKDIQFLLIGPAWVLAFLYRKLNISY